MRPNFFLSENREGVEPATDRTGYPTLLFLDRHGGILYNNPPNSDVGKLIGIRINNIELVDPKMRNGWLVFDLDPNYLAIGKNLIGINFMNSKYNKIIRLDIEKLEIHVVYKK